MISWAGLAVRANPCEGKSDEMHRQHEHRWKVESSGVLTCVQLTRVARNCSENRDAFKDEILNVAVPLEDVE